MDPISVSLVPLERIGQKILVIRGQKVMLDLDLAELYGVSTGTLNQTVKRQRERFPEDFMFQLTVEEYEILKSQFVISSVRDGGSGWNLEVAFCDLKFAAPGTFKVANCDLKDYLPPNLKYQFGTSRLLILAQ